MTHELKLRVTDEILSAQRLDPESFLAEIKMAAAAKLYELGRMSQERAAEVAGLSRRDFLFSLGRYGVTPYQCTISELTEELTRA